jgi:predicted metal-dependent hydrolase
VRDARAKRLRIIVNENGVRLTVPLRCADRVAREFLFEHRAWLTQHWQQRPQVKPLEAFALFETNEIMLRAERLPLQWRQEKFTQVYREDQDIVVALTARAGLPQAKRALKEFYLQEARRDIGAWLPKYLPHFPTALLSMQLRALSSLWGSLSPSDGLLLDLSLVLGKPSAFEYVLVHELCHLVHRDHSRRFWREVEKHFPYWREERHYLRGEGLLLKSELKRVIA